MKQQQQNIFRNIHGSNKFKFLNIYPTQELKLRPYNVAVLDGKSTEPKNGELICMFDEILTLWFI